MKTKPAPIGIRSSAFMTASAHTARSGIGRRHPRPSNGSRQAPLHLAPASGLTQELVRKPGAGQGGQQ